MKTAIIDNPAALYWASFNRFELRIPGAAVADIAQPGPADESVEHWAPKVERPERCTPEALAAELKEYGAWDAEELADDAANWRRIVWCAACNVAEDENPDCSEPLTP